MPFVNVGMITGSARIKEADTDFSGGASRTVAVRNSQLGGKISVEYNISDESSVWTTITSSNYTQYIYGNGANTNWDGTDNYDGCTFLTSAPVVDKMSY